MSWIKDRVAKFKLDLHNLFGFPIQEKSTLKFLTMRNKNDYRYPNWIILKELEGPYDVKSLPKPEEGEEIAVIRVTTVIVRKIEPDV